MARVLRFRQRRKQGVTAVALEVARLAQWAETNPEVRVNLRSATERLYALTHRGPDGPAAVLPFGMMVAA